MTTLIRTRSRWIAIVASVLVPLSAAAYGADPSYAPRMQTACPGMAAFAKDHPNPIYDQKLMNDAAGVTNLELRNKILALYRVDDHSKKTGNEIMALIDRYGFPTQKTVGIGGVYAAFMLVQHADLDPEFQRKTLREVKALYEKHDVPGAIYAYLEDRVRVAEGRNQIFGTQIAGGFDAKELVVRPVEDPTDLDARRAAASMPSEKDYLCYVEFRSGKRVVFDQQ